MSGTTTAPSIWKRRLSKAASLLKRPLYANAVYLLGISVVSGLAGFAFWRLAAQGYQAEDVGVASAVLAVMPLLSGVSGLGVSTGLVRFLPESRLPKRLLDTVFTFTLAAVLLVAGVFLAGTGLWSPSLVVLQERLVYAVGFLANAATTALGVAIQMAFVARRRAFYALLYTCVASGGRLLLVSLLADWGALGLVGSVTIAAMVSLVLSFAVFLPKVEPAYRLRFQLCTADLAMIIRFSVGNCVATLVSQLPQMVLPLIILELLGPASGGYTYVAWMLGILLSSPGVALAGSAFAEGSSTPGRLPAIVSRAVAVGVLITVPVSVVLWSAAPRVLLLFGDDYARESLGLLRWLAVAAPLRVLVDLYFARLRVRKQIGWLVALSCVVAAATLGASVLLVSRVGIVASGIGWLAGNGLVVAVASSEIWRSRSGDVQP